jgi:hypothetical protein
MKIRAFNLVPGAVFELSWLTGEEPLVAMTVERDCDREEVDVKFRLGTQGAWDYLTLGFCEQVDLIGLSANPDDFGDTDFGV